jgi:hypothetical protein
MRADEVYREILPALCRVARDSGRNVIIKLHPFETRSQRRRTVENILTTEQRQRVTLVEGPLINELLSGAWFGITVQSTTVLDCLQHGICCFLCSWLATSPFGYVEQYARFGVGEVLQNVEQFGEIPKRLADFHDRRPAPLSLSDSVDPAMLKRWLTSGPGGLSGERYAS